jgi:hypothetical protein
MAASNRRLATVALATLTVALCAGTLGAAAAAADTAAPQYRGVQLHSLWWDSSNADLDRELDMSRDLGANVVRVDVGWSSLESGAKGQYSDWYLTKLDRFVNGAYARGMKVIATVMTTPCWASSAPESLKQGCAGEWWNRNVQMYPPTRASDYADAARFITSRYGTKLAAFEVWNEPNLDEDRFFIAPDEPQAYADLLKAAYPAIKQGNAQVEVLAGSLAYMNGGFVERLYALGIGGYYDGLAVHPYNDGAPTAANWAGVQWIRGLQRAAGDDKPLWLTEFGWSTCRLGSGWCKTSDQQAAYTRAGFAALASDPNVRGVVAYNLRDKGTNPDSMEDNFGLVRRDFTPKPAYRAVREALTSASPPVTSPPAAPPAMPPTTPPATTPGTTPGGTTKPPRGSRRKHTRIRVRVKRRRGIAIARGRAPRGAKVMLRTTRCRSAGAAAVWRVRVGDSGRFARRLGSARRLAGCTVRATLAGR